MSCISQSLNWLVLRTQHPEGKRTCPRLLPLATCNSKQYSQGLRTREKYCECWPPSTKDNNMDSSESISSSMDTTNDSIDVVGHFKKHDSKTLDPIHRHRHHLGNYHYHNYNPSPSQYKSLLFKSKKRIHKRRQSILLNNNKLNLHDEETISNKLPPDKECCAANETPPPPTTSSSTATTTNDHLPSQQKLSHLNLDRQQLELPSSSTSSINTFMTCCSAASQPESELQQNGESTLDAYNQSPGKKTVLFDKVTVYHFNRSQGFTSIPTEGGSTLGMKRKHFLRRRLSVDLYEEVRRRSRRQILLKIYFEKRKKEDEELQQRTMSNRGRPVSSSSSQANTPDSDDNSGEQGNTGVRVDANQNDEMSDKKVIDVDSIGRPNEDEDDEEETFSDLSDISDSELESDSNIFLQPLGVKLRRSLLRASGVFRIDPIEKKDCKKIRDSRERSGCKCFGQCIPQYCECSRLGVRCHVDRASFPCGCSSDGCKNPEGRTEFDSSRVRKHFEEKILESHSLLSSNEEELIATTPPSSTTSEESC